MRVFDATTSSLTIGWDHAEGPVQQYKISYAPMTGDPITEYVSSSTEPPPDQVWNFPVNELFWSHWFRMAH